MIDRLRAWRVAFYASAAVFVLSLALSGPGDAAARTLAYMGAGGMIVAILGMGVAATRGKRAAGPTKLLG